VLDAAALLEGWRAGGPPHARLDRLLRRLAPAAAIERDSLGERNQRLLALYLELGRGPLEAVAPCPRCGERNEFSLPADRLLSELAPAPDAAVEVDGRRFRLPRMADLLTQNPKPLPERCLESGGAASPETVVEAGRRFDELDPAANVAIDLVCATCGMAYGAALDVADHVATAFDRALAQLYRDIDAIASTYGWSEREIAALPSERRGRYVAMISARGALREASP
jgi:hypothetical protein